MRKAADMIWLIVILFTLGIGAFLTRPFLTAGAASADASASASIVARDQLSEIERELAEGVIDEGQAEAARLDVRRRLLRRLPDATSNRRTLALVERKFLAGVLAGGVGLGSLILYGINGAPDIPAVSRKAGEQPTWVATAPPTGAPHPGSPAAQSTIGPARAPGSVEDMIQGLVARLEKTPDDANGWRMLGWSHSGVGQFQEAAAAYTKAIALQPTIGALRTARGEALVRANDGKVSPEAKADFDAALKIDANDATARYGLGLSLQQGGDNAGALDMWLQALAGAGPNDAWAADLDGRVRALAAELKVDVTAKLAAPAAPPAGGILGKLNQQYPTAAPRERGPTADDVKAAETLAPGDRQAMINGMVDSLQQRLDKTPRDAEGWIKLIKSRQVLGQADQAKAALTRAMQVFADDAGERSRIATAALELGVKP